MAKAASTDTTETQAAVTTDGVAPADTETVKETKTPDGLRWHNEPANDDQVRVFVTTKDGQQFNVVATDEAAGRKHLRDYLKSNGSL